MTLAEMADFVCTKVRQTDAAAVAACKTYLRQRAEMIWNDQLWKATLTEAFAYYDPSSADTNLYTSSDGCLWVADAM